MSNAALATYLDDDEQTGHAANGNTEAALTNGTAVDENTLYGKQPWHRPKRPCGGAMACHVKRFVASIHPPRRCWGRRGRECLIWLLLSESICEHALLLLPPQRSTWPA